MTKSLDDNFKSLIEKANEKRAPKYDGSTCSSTRVSGFEQGAKLPSELLLKCLEALRFISLESIVTVTNQGPQNFKSANAQVAEQTLSEIRKELERD